MRYNENQIVLLIDNEVTLLACVMQLAGVCRWNSSPSDSNSSAENEAVDLIPYRNQVGKDAFRRELETFSNHPEDRKEQFWLDAARYYVRKYDEDEVRCQWALPDSWR